MELTAPFLRNDYVYDLVVTRSIDFLRTRRTIKTTRIQLNKFRALHGTGKVDHQLRPGLEMGFDLSKDLDAFMYEYLLTHGRYETEVESVLSEKITRETTFVDVGANLGYFTLLFAGRAKSVYAFEPIPDVFRSLSRNVALNGLQNVKVYQRAVSRKGGSLKLFESTISSGHDSTVKRFEHNKSMIVEAVSLDEAVGLPSGDVVLKVDVEGAEMDVILGALGLIESGKVHTVVLEWARYLYPKVTELKERFDLYSSLGEVEVLGGGLRKRKVTERQELPEICNLLITIKR